jgi:hypothetical protein
MRVDMFVCDTLTTTPTAYTTATSPLEDYSYFVTAPAGGNLIIGQTFPLDYINSEMAFRLGSQFTFEIGTFSSISSLTVTLSAMANNRSSPVVLATTTIANAVPDAGTGIYTGQLTIANDVVATSTIGYLEFTLPPGATVGGYIGLTAGNTNSSRASGSIIKTKRYFDDVSTLGVTF